jgi:AbrB family looped-hinge helix DNA binding protein
MPVRESSVSPKGQVTIPQDLRIRLGLKPKDRVVFELEEDGIKIRPAQSRLLRHFGTVTPNRRPEDLRALRADFEQGVADELLAKMASEREG